MMKAKGFTWQVSIGVLVLLLCVSATKGEQTPKINLNTATFSQLDSLPGIGPVIAERILELRERSGPFQRIEDLLNIRGIGEKKFLQLQDLITVKPLEERIQNTEYRSRNEEGTGKNV